MTEVLAVFRDPWRAQIAMLPVRREYPDEKHKAARQRRAEGCAKARAIGVGLAKAKAVRNLAAVEAIFGKKEMTTAGEIIKITGMSRETVSKHLTQLEAAGKIVRHKLGRVYVWRKSNV